MATENKDQGFKPTDSPEPFENSSGYTQSLIDPEKPEMTAETSVEGRVESLLDQNSGLMKRADALGRMKAGASGAGSSSMASRAAQSVLYDIATPIASQDAQTASRFKELGFNYDAAIGQMNEASRLRFNEMDKQHNLSVDMLNRTNEFQEWAMERGWDEQLTQGMMQMYSSLSSSALSSMAAMAGSQQVTAQEGKDFMQSWKDAIASLASISTLDISFD